MLAPFAYCFDQVMKKRIHSNHPNLNQLPKESYGMRRSPNHILMHFGFKKNMNVVLYFDDRLVFLGMVTMPAWPVAFGGSPQDSSLRTSR